MERILISNLKEGYQVFLAGFVHSLRLQSSICFIELRDISGICQLVVLAENAKTFASVKELKEESVIEVEGIVKKSMSKKFELEIEVKSLNILSVPVENLPIPINEKEQNEAEQEQRLNYRWLDIRKQNKALIFKVWTELEKGFREYFYRNNFLQIYPPSFMSTPSETGAEVFEVNYFGGKAYLAQSPQFYKQMAIAAGLEKVFMFSPVYRAEESFTSRHVTEFTGLDIELAYIKSHYEVMSVEEELIVSGIKRVNESLKLKIEIPSLPFPKISMAEAKEKLKKRGVKSEKEGDLSSEEEKILGQIIKEELGHDFVFVTEYPVSVRPFYHKRVEENNTLTKSADLIFKGIEITTVAQREHRYEILKSQALEKGMSLENLKHYLSFFKYGCPPHGGFGFGMNRMVMKLLNLENVREATFLPRDVKRLTP